MGGCLNPQNHASSNHQMVVTGKNWEIQNFAKGFAAVLAGCLFWLLLLAPQNLFLNVLQVGQCLDPATPNEARRNNIVNWSCRLLAATLVVM
jgi:hypothetical protein